MSSKSLLTFVAAFGILAILLAFLGVNYVPRISAFSSTKEDLAILANLEQPNYLNQRYQRSIAPQLAATADLVQPDYLNQRYPRSIAPQLAVTADLVQPDYFNQRYPRSIAP